MLILCPHCFTDIKRCPIINTELIYLLTGRAHCHRILWLMEFHANLFSLMPLARFTYHTILFSKHRDSFLKELPFQSSLIKEN